MPTWQMEPSQREKDAVEVVLATGATLRRWGGRDEQMDKLDLMIPGSGSLGTDPATAHLGSCFIHFCCELGPGGHHCVAQNTPS